MDGARCLGSLADLFDVAGQYRGMLVSLQAQARLVNGTADAEGR